MLNRTILIDDGAKEIVVYRAMREGIGVTVSNAPSIFCDVTNRGDYVSEIKKILSLADFKWLYIDFERGKEKLTSMFTWIRSKYLGSCDIFRIGRVFLCSPLVPFKSKINK